MKFLLDTHIWLWCLLEPKKLSHRVARALKEEDNELWLSPISVWEALVLCEKKRLAVREEDPSLWMTQALQKIPLKEAPLTHEVALATQKIHLPHRDPADRFLIATALVHGLTLVTADKHIIASKQSPTLPNA